MRKSFRFTSPIVEGRRTTRSPCNINNWRKHREDEASLEARTWKVDPFSTGALFAGWKEREGEPLLWKTPMTYEPLVVYLPSTWLLQKGWLRGGGRFSVHHTPSQRPT